MGNDGIAVVGAGIGGLTTALALWRSGFDVTVYEQADELREVGAGIQLAPSAVRLLYRLGLGQALDRVAVRPVAVEMRRWDGDSVIARTTLGAECEERYGAPYYVAHRADVHRALVAALPGDVVRTGRRCVGVTDGQDGATLRFADGEEVRAALAVGADGIHSVVRAGMVTDRPRYSGQVIYRGVVPSTNLAELVAEPKVLLWLGPGRHGVCYPISGGRAVSFGATIPMEDWVNESWTEPGDMADLAHEYDGWSPTLRAVLAEASQAGRWALHDRDAIERWSGRHTTILGDAAHPMLPFMAQGANQAVEDAVALALCLRDTPGRIPEALERYEGSRRARTGDVQEGSRANATTLHLEDGADQRERDAGFDAGLANLESQAWLFGYDVERVLG